MIKRREDCKMDSSEYGELQQPLRGEHNHYDEEKTLNISPLPFHPNIPSEENGYAPSEGNSSNGTSTRTVRPNDNFLYGFRVQTLCTLVAAAIVLSLLATGLSIYAIIKYTEAAKELQTARENRGMYVVTTTYVVGKLYNYQHCFV